MKISRKPYFLRLVTVFLLIIIAISSIFNQNQILQVKKSSFYIQYVKQLATVTLEEIPKVANIRIRNNNLELVTFEKSEKENIYIIKFSEYQDSIIKFFLYCEDEKDANIKDFILNSKAKKENNTILVYRE